MLFPRVEILFSIGVFNAPVTLKVWITFPKRLFIRKLDFCIKNYFFPNKRKNLRPFHTDVPIRSNAPRTLGAGAARNRETMKPERTLVY